MNQWPVDSATNHEAPWCRSNDGQIAGVAAGISEQTGVPVHVVRVFFIAMAAFGGTGFLLYLGAWLLMLPPVAPSLGSGIYSSGSTDRSAVPTALGGVLIGFGALLALLTLNNFRGIPFGIVLLAFVGIVLLNRRPKVPLATTGGPGFAYQDPIVPDPTPAPHPGMTAPPPPAPLPPIEQPLSTFTPAEPQPEQPGVDPTAVMEVTPEQPTAPTETGGDVPDSGNLDSTGDTVNLDGDSGNLDGDSGNLGGGDSDSDSDSGGSDDPSATDPDSTDDPDSSGEHDVSGTDNTTVMDVTPTEGTPDTADGSQTSEAQGSPASTAEGTPAGEADVTRTGVGQAQFGSPDPKPTRPDASAFNPAGSNPTDSTTLGSNPTDPTSLGSNPADPTTLGSNPADPTSLGYDPTDPATFGYGPGGTTSFTADPSNLGSRSHWAVPRAAGETYLARPPRPPGPPLASITLTAILAVVGVALVLNTVADVFVGTTTVTGIGLVIVGAAIASTSFRGRTLPLLPIAGVLSLVLVFSPVLDHLLSDGAGAQEITVGSADELQPAYQLGVGAISLDLTRVELTEDTVVTVEVGTGAIEIWLPPDLPTEVYADVNVGYVEALGSERGGIGSSLHVLPRLGDDPDAPKLVLLTSVDIGGIDVSR